MRTQADILRRQKEASVELAKTALAAPGMFPQSGRLREAQRNLLAAEAELKAAKAAWVALIAPAQGWAPDPLKATP